MDFKIKRKLHIKQVKDKNNIPYVVVLDMTYVKSGVPLIGFEADNNAMNDACDYVKVLQRVGLMSLVWQ